MFSYPASRLSKKVAHPLKSDESGHLLTDLKATVYIRKFLKSCIGFKKKSKVIQSMNGSVSL